MTVHVGIDLAWGTRARTGLAAVAGGGALLRSTSAVTDAEIDGWLADLGGVVNVAIDAPLIVTNPSGMRACERLVTRSYGAYEAGCHPSNLAMPHLDPPRARALAQRHGWRTDPGHTADVDSPGAIEVYPHAAMVGLFRLGRTLKYKRGPVESRAAEFARLLDLLEGLDNLELGGHHRWRQIREAAGRAARPVELDRLEDEVDAILCAHLAWLWHHDPDALQVFGDGDEGYIVAPPPPGHPPDSRTTASTVGRHGARVEVLGNPVTRDSDAWQAAVRTAAVGDDFPEPTRVSVEIELRLDAALRAARTTTLEGLLATTIDGLDRLLPRPATERAATDRERIDHLVGSARNTRPGEPAGATIVVRPLPAPRAE